jgi:Protein of unknown function (DUF2752)
MSVTMEPQARKNTTRWRTRLVLVLLVAVVLPVGATLLYNFAPSEHTFYPRCLLYVLTGLHCPGCGSTRCAAALLHGNIEQALAYNPLMVIALPLIIYGCARSGVEIWTGTVIQKYRVPGWLLKCVVVILLSYGVARNIDVYPLNLLAPHEISQPAP